MQGAVIRSDFDSIDAMNEALAFFVTEARKVEIDEEDPEPGIKRKGDLYLNVVAVSAKIAPFRHPTLAAIHTSSSRENVLERQGVTELEVAEEVARELFAEMRRAGRLPRKAMKLIENGNGSGVSNRAASEAHQPALKRAI